MNEPAFTVHRVTPQMTLLKRPTICLFISISGSLPVGMQVSIVRTKLAVLPESL